MIVKTKAIEGDLVIDWGTDYKRDPIIVLYKFALKLTPQRTKWLMIWPGSKGHYEYRWSPRDFDKGDDTTVVRPPKSYRKIVKQIFEVVGR